MKALQIKFECLNCSSVLSLYCPADTVAMIKKVIENSKNCSCGKECNFRIMEFDNAEYELKK